MLFSLIYAALRLNRKLKSVRHDSFWIEAMRQWKMLSNPWKLNDISFRMTAIHCKPINVNELWDNHINSLWCSNYFWPRNMQQSIDIMWFSPSASMYSFSIAVNHWNTFKGLLWNQSQYNTPLNFNRFNNTRDRNIHYNQFNWNHALYCIVYSRLFVYFSNYSGSDSQQILKHRSNRIKFKCNQIQTQRRLLRLQL